MFRNRPYYFRLMGLILALLLCIGLIWLLMNHTGALLGWPIAPGRNPWQFRGGPRI